MNGIEIKTGSEQMEYGMPFLIETKTIEDCVQLCHELGLSFVELNMNFPQCQLDRMSADELNALKEKYGIYFTIHLDENLNVCDFNPYVREAYLHTIKDTITLAKKINAPIINMHLHQGVYITLPGQRRFLFAEYPEEYMKYAKMFLELCDWELNGTPIKVAIENTGGFCEHEKKLIEMILKDSHLGLTLDIGHSHAADDVDIPFYMIHKDKLIHMHAHDALGKSNHLAFGDGDIDLKGRLALAREAGARVVLETKTIKALKTTMEYLKCV